VVRSEATGLTIDELAAATGASGRRIRSFQTLGLLPSPELKGRTGIYGPGHQDRLRAILQLQDQGFSLESLSILFDALEAGRSLAAVLGLPEATVAEADRDADLDSAELYGFSELQRSSTGRGRDGGRPLLSVVPTTMWVESEAS
jgi:DNA-binding transcriptional MerR regulator